MTFMVGVILSAEGERTQSEHPRILLNMHANTEDGFMVARMELKVWVEGIQRIVCGVTETTTCQDVVYALAHATGKTGRFTLIERWRNNERLLAPNEYPLKILMKWGEYSNDVQFILQRSALEPKTSNGPSGLRPSGHPRVEPPSRATLSQSPPVTQDRPRQSPHTHKDLKKSLTFSGGHADLRRLDAGTPSPSQGCPPLSPGMMSPTGPRHSDFPYSSPPTSPHWEGQMLPTEACKADQQSCPVAWRPPAPPPYELVRGNPPPPPSASRIGVDNVRATSHWSAPWPGSHSPPATSQPTPLSPHSPIRSPPATEPPYSLGRREQRPELPRNEPVYSDARRPPFPGYAHPGSGSLNTTPPGSLYQPRGPSPSQMSPMYNGPPPPKPPHISGPRELPPYRHPPPPSSVPTKASPSHGSPRKVTNVQTSPTKQPLPPPPSAQVPLSSNKVPNPHQIGSSSHSSPIRHPSPTRHSSPTRHPSPSRSCPVGSSVINSPSPHSNTKNPRSGSPVKAMQVRHNMEEFPGGNLLDKGIAKTGTEEQSAVRHGEYHPRKEDGANSNSAKEVIQSNIVNNSIGKPMPDVQSKTNQHNRGSIDRLAVESVSVFGRRGTSEEPFTNKDSPHPNCSDRLNTSLDSPHSNHCIKSPHTRRSPAKESPKSGSEGVRVSHNNKMEQVVIDGKYRDLIKLINLQRDKLNNQQVEMTKYEAEIAYLEGRSREDESRLAHVTSEIERHEKLAQQIDEEVNHLQQLEQEAEGAHQAEDKVKAEISALQAQLAHCENQLATHREKVSELEKSMDEEHQRSEEEARAQQDAMVREIEKLQAAIAQASAQAEHAQVQSQQILQEMADSEKTIADKKKEVEKLVMEMKDANLESLSITPSEEVRTLLEGKTGATKPGSSRRMIGSPRQLENAVPTSKNPHGVWV
ncbi:flocculation protein FLO11-like isoform X3 [Portunus trituberculatus]|uniref:flocculation protein FLO11-like isoform X3 n=2 Tax=Portunus trituberculatus TaxID=210409 RepID=UPI001E1D1710|nr:flocculation protein FLO11-like isoform X3 [Portunus trituberculatus]